MSDEIVVGICRFSYLGLSDWAAFRRDKRVDDARLDRLAVNLYAESRMQARFRAFEAVCLPSILAQSDPRFVFLIVSSPRMPQVWRNRLHALCDPHQQIHLQWAEEPTLGAALAATLCDLHEISEGRLWQFRLDDDDAIAADYLQRLRAHAARMAGLENCAISVARGLNVVLSPGEPTCHLEYRTPFQSAGLALRLSEPGRSIFAFGHFGMRMRFSHFVDHEAIGALMLKWPSDSRPLDLARLPEGSTRITPAVFERHLRDSFPFLANQDFEQLRPA